MSEIKKGKHKHFKGFIVEVLGVARHSESLEEMVVYKHDSEEFGKDAMWVRTKAMFLESVIVEGKEIPRFEFMGE